MEILDVAVVVGYFFFCLVIGLLGIRKVRDIRDYAIGNGTFSAGMVGATLFATHVGAGSTVGVVEEISSSGLIFAVGLLVQPFMWVLMSWIFVPRIMQFKQKGCLSISDIAHELYGPSARILADFWILWVSVTTVCSQLIAVGYLFQTFFQTSLIEGALIGFAAVVLYSFAGGVRAVVFTDVFQAFVILIVLPIISLVGYYDVGGISGIVATVPPGHFEISLTKQNIVLLISIVVWMLLWVAPVFIQRFLMAKDEAQLKSALNGLFIASFPLGLMLLLMGFVVSAKIGGSQ